MTEQGKDEQGRDEQGRDEQGRDEPGAGTAPVRAAMPRDQRAYVIAMCAIIGASFAYAACEWGRWPHLLYLPLRGEFAFEAGSSIAIHYFGIIMWGVGGLVCGALVGALLCRLVPRPWPDRALHLFGAWAITALLLAGSFFMWGLWPW
jgi:hypothetical protein